MEYHCRETSATENIMSVASAFVRYVIGSTGRRPTRLRRHYLDDSSTAPLQTHHVLPPGMTLEHGKMKPSRSLPPREWK